MRHQAIVLTAALATSFVAGACARTESPAAPSDATTTMTAATAAASSPPPGPIVGGGCKYDDFPGTCTATDSGKFTFEGTLDGNKVSLPDNTTNDLSGALAKPGAKVECSLRFQTHGTCTPCVLSVGACGKPAWDALRARAK